MKGAMTGEGPIARKICELRRAKDAAERADRVKTRILAATSHDLRQPLQALQLFHQVLANTASPDQHMVLERARQCLSRICDLTNDLIELAKVETGAAKMVLSDCSVSEIVEELLPTYHQLARAKGLSLRYVACSATVITHPGLLKRIIGNFLSNAVKYTERGGIVAGCRRREGALWFEVVDSGKGIPDEKLHEIFQEFHQLDDSLGEDDHGSGLGLAIVDRCVQLLGTEITVRSRYGRGSSFAIRISRPDSAVHAA